MGTPSRIVIISAGLREGSKATRLAEMVCSASNQATEIASSEIVELRSIAHDIIEASVSGDVSIRLADLYERLRAADGLVVSTPIYKAAYPGLFKAFFDGLDHAVLQGKPVLLAATGETERHSLAIDLTLRPLFAYLQTVIVPTGVFASTKDWTGENGDVLRQRLGRAASEFGELLSGRGTGRVYNDDIDQLSDTMRSLTQQPLR